MLGGAATPALNTGSPTARISSASRTGASVTAAATPLWARRATRMSPSVAPDGLPHPSITTTEPAGAASMASRKEGERA